MANLQFSTAQLKKRLDNKYKDRPFFEAYRIINALSSISSYAFNTLSAFTGFAFVFFFIITVIPYPIGAGAITIIFLGILEGLKRTTTGKLFLLIFKAQKISFILLFVCSGLSGISILFSYQGAKQTIIQFATPPEQITDTRLDSIRAEAKAIDKQISEARETRWKGTTTTKSQTAIKELTKQKTFLSEELARIEKRTDQANDRNSSRHEIKTKAKSEYFALFTFICELLFYCAMLFCNYYDARSYSELKDENIEQEQEGKSVITGDGQNKTKSGKDKKTEQAKDSKTKSKTAKMQIDIPNAGEHSLNASTGETITEVKTIDNTDTEAIKAAIQKANGNISTYQRRLAAAISTYQRRLAAARSEKSKKTNYTGLKKWEGEKKYYQDLLEKVRID